MLIGALARYRALSMDILNIFQNGSVPGGLWGLLLLVFAALNLKNLPLVWHVSLQIVLLFLKIHVDGIPP